MAQIRRQRYDSNIACRALRLGPSRPGARERMAGIPQWDGHVRFPKVTGNKIWSSKELMHEARIALYDMARRGFDGSLGDEMADDPEDPPIVRRDILNQGHPETQVMAHAPEWGWRGSLTQLKQQVALEERANQFRRR